MNHTSTAAASIAGSLASILIYVVEKKFNFDLSGEEANITAVVMAAIVFFVQQKGNKDGTPPSTPAVGNPASNGSAS